MEDVLCKRCKRKLNGEKSIERGYGNSCWKNRNIPFTKGHLSKKKLEISKDQKNLDDWIGG